MALQEQKPLALALVFWLVLQAPLSAAVLTVSGGCTLSDAITAANTGVATGGCPAGDAAGPDRIVLTGDVALTTVDNTTDGANGLPSVTSEITIQGDGHTVSSAAPSNFRIFHVASPGDLTLLDTTVSEGSASTVGSESLGGGIFNRGSLALVHSSISGNNVSASYAEGGGIYNSGTATLVNSTLSENIASGSYAKGAAIHNAGGTVTLTSSTVSQNIVTGSTAGYGGGISNQSGELTLENSTISNNRAGGATVGYGGGVFNYSGTVALTNTTFFLNSANVSSSGFGGALYNYSGTVDLNNSTLYGNIANTLGTGPGEALYNGTSGSMTLTSSIVLIEAYGAGANCAGPGAITDGDRNFGNDDSCPRVGPVSAFASILGDHGGPVMTHALYAGSSAIDQDASCDLLIDARGAPRDGNCDSGAFEYGADDEFESSGENGTDDDCFGHHIPFGKAERHLHRQDAEDWIWFEAQQDATYEIRTSNLLGGTDTVLELAEVCGAPFITDNDGGGGSSSLIVYTSAADALLDVRISEEVGSAPQFGYDISVTCTADCPVCALPGGDSFELADETIYSYRRIEACNEVLSTGSTTLEAGSETILRAGDRFSFENGFNVQKDARLAVEIDPDLLP